MAGGNSQTYICGRHGLSTYFDWKKLRQIAGCGAWLIADISHISGLVVASARITSWYC